MKRQMLFVFAIVVCSLNVMANHFEYDSLMRLYWNGKNLNLGELPTNTTQVIRGHCYAPQGYHEKPNPLPMAMVLTVVDYPADGPVPSKRVVRGSITEGHKSDADAIADFNRAIERRADFGLLFPLYEYGGEVLHHYFSADVAACIDHSYKSACSAAAIRNADNYYAVLVDYGKFNISTPRLACYLNKPRPSRSAISTF